VDGIGNVFAEKAGVNGDFQPREGQEVDFRVDVVRSVDFVSR
jgi:hypothetical protein